MITFLKSAPVGNAVRGLLDVPKGATARKVLRKAQPPFSGHDDAGAVVAWSSRDGTDFVDIQRLKNGSTYFYCPFYLVAGDWVAGDVESVLVSAAISTLGADPLAVVRQRLEDGLRTEVQANRLPHANGVVPCLTAPPAFEGTMFPIVTVHLDSDAIGQRALGEVVTADYQDDDGSWVEAEGYISAVRLRIISWVAQNSDLRILTREAIKKVLTANLPIFASVGMDQVEFSMTDVEDMESYGSPMYQTIITFNCNATFIVSNRVDAVEDVAISVAGL